MAAWSICGAPSTPRARLAYRQADHDPDRQDEQRGIIERIRRGERVEAYETVRQRKDGSLFEISLAVSPIKDAEGRIIGASKIARDIAERSQALDRQQLLLREMNHRVKNLFTLAGSVRHRPRIATAV